MKLHLSWVEQVELLRNSGLKISNETVAMTSLTTQNYYRLRGYFHVYLEDDSTGAGIKSSQFKNNVSFEDILELVQFDRELRVLLFEALSQFEIQLRTKFAYHGGAIDPYIHLTGNGLDPRFTNSSFPSKAAHVVWIENYEKKIQRHKSEPFVRWHLTRYEGAMLIWVAIEMLDFGDVSKLYRVSSQRLSALISAEFNIGSAMFKNWVASLNDLRNAVVDQNRLWNRTFTYSTKKGVNQLPSELIHLTESSVSPANKIYSRLAVLVWIDQQNQFQIGFTRRLIELLENFPLSPHLDLSQMGFPKNWQELKLWN